MQNGILRIALGDTRANLISIIGPPAAGKTTLAEALAREMPAELIREDYAGNPFLAGSCLGRRELALPSQLYFLFSRAGQLNRESWPVRGLAVSDYGFCQDALYARHCLSGEELATYHRLAARVEPLVQPPDLVLHLDVPEQALLERIARRGRRFETGMTAEFLRRMRQEYERLVPALDCPAMTVDAGRDLRDGQALAEIVQEVRTRLERPGGNENQA